MGSRLGLAGARGQRLAVKFASSTTLYEAASKASQGGDAVRPVRPCGRGRGLLPARRGRAGQWQHRTRRWRAWPWRRIRSWPTRGPSRWQC
ncbi:hypothetical protein BDA96_03G094000 [Sorghum bicolor]|uniref:Uncharacterized protein n=2 Tax=Sorghum bicolor TaxID=4558 RepID=A0A921RAB8_SORBI|nr:hypothetical protein BDA96_03G094000 [Sorghum bicolor]OQU86427.1 hypothetical protein SORBI_3003G089650 [Sorghum bicolor]